MTPWDDVKGSWSAIAGLSIQQFTDEYIKCIGEKNSRTYFFLWNQFDEKKFIYSFFTWNQFHEKKLYLLKT